MARGPSIKRAPSLKTDIKQIARGWRWTHRPLVPRSVEALETEPRDFPTGWARTEAGKAARAFLQEYAMKPLMRFETSPRVEGRDVLDRIEPPVIFVANHSSHLDAPMVLSSLPPSWRARTATGAAADYFFDVWWRATATALVFNAFPVERGRGSGRATRLARDLIAQGWNILMFPEGTRSKDGWVREFRMGAARLAVEEHIPVVPIALRGTYQSMPRGKGWPTKGRLPVQVRFGRAVVPTLDEDPTAFNARIRDALAATLDEDRTTWFEAVGRSARGETPSVAGPEDAARWRRMWEASRPLPKPQKAFKR